MNAPLVADTFTCMDPRPPHRSTTPTPAPRVRVLEEHEGDVGWEYAVEATLPGQAATTHEVTLSWRDHDYWCGGQVAPSRVVEAIVAYVLGQGGRTLPARFDCSTARRWMPRLDSDLRTLL